MLDLFGDEELWAETLAEEAVVLRRRAREPAQAIAAQAREHYEK